MLRRVLLIFVALIFLPAAASAAPSDTTFRAFFESLPHLSEADLKETLEGKAPIRAAFASIELNRRTNNQAYAARAVRLLAGVLRKEKNQQWAHYGMARALERSPKSLSIVRSFGLAAEGMGMEPVKVEIHAQLQHALKLDPEFGEALEMASDFGDVASTMIGETPNYTSASSYFEAARTADEASLDLLIRDIAIIATPQELLNITQGDLKKRIEAVQLFWKKRGVRDGITAEERVLEHYRRIHFARKAYGPPVPYYNVWGKRRSGLEATMDDRGLIYVRFGPPHNIDEVSDEIAEAEKRKRGAEVWAYLQPDGRYHTYLFLNGRLEANPLRFMGAASNNALQDAVSNEKLMRALVKFDARYAFIAMRQENVRLHQFMVRADPAYAQIAAGKAADAMEDAARQADRIAERTRKMLFAAFDMDAARPRFPNPLTLFHDLATFRGSAPQCTDVVYSVAAAVPAYRLSLAVADTFTWEAQSIDTVVTGNVSNGGHLRASGVFCMTPDYNSYVRLTARADSTTGVTAGGSLEIPNYRDRDNGLMMSSILFAKTEDGPFVRGNARLSLVPPNQFREDESFRIFYELYNLPAGRAYRTEITLTTTEGNPISRLFKGKTSTKVTFEGTAEGTDLVQELRTIVPQIQAGEAEVVVRVTDLQTNQSTTRKKTVFILPAEASVKN
jgi:GWxTD domain-containing protein